MPAHAAIWGKGYPELEITCADGPSLLNPIDDGSAFSTYTVLDNLLTEFAPIFYTADTVHLGGDEVESLACWNESAAVRAFMAAKSIPTVDALRNYFQTRVQAIAAAHGLRSMFWEEVFDKGYTVQPSSIFDVWLSFTEVDAVVAAGHNVVVSYGLYLDMQVPVGGTHYFWADTWQNFWENGFVAFPSSPFFSSLPPSLPPSTSPSHTTPLPRQVNQPQPSHPGREPQPVGRAGRRGQHRVPHLAPRSRRR